VAGKMFDVVVGPPIRLDARGVREADLLPGKTLTFEAVVSKKTSTDLRVQTVTKGSNVIDVR